MTKPNQFQHRVWDYTHEKMIYGVTPFFSEKCNIVFSLECINIEEFKFEPLLNCSKPMRPTGLVDKNKKEIFESDLYKIDGIICEIVWMYDGFKLVGEEGFDGIELFPQCRDGMWGEIIGNIYENPKLLK